MELDKLKEIIGNVMNIDTDTITEETTFVDDLGADSLDVFQIVMALEEEYDIEFGNDAIEEIQSLKDAVEILRKIIA